MSKTPGPRSRSPSLENGRRASEPIGHTVSRWPSSRMRGWSGPQRHAGRPPCSSTRAGSGSQPSRMPTASWATAAHASTSSLGDSVQTSASTASTIAGRSACARSSRSDSGMSASRNRYGGAVTDWSAEGDLARAEERAGVEVRSLADLSELDDARGVFDAVWPASDGSTQVAGNLMRALVHAGGYASAAYRDGQPIGAALAFVGRHRRDGGMARAPALAHGRRARPLPRPAHRHGAEDAPAGVGAGAGHRHDRVDLRPAGATQRTRQPAEAGRGGRRVRGRLLRQHGRRHQQRRPDGPALRLVAPGLPARVLGVDGPARPHRSDRPRGERSRRHRDRAARGHRRPARDRPGGGGQWRIAVREAFLAAFADGFRVIGVSPIGNYVLERQP